MGFLVRPGGFEPLAFRVGAERSIQLSYDRKLMWYIKYHHSIAQVAEKIKSNCISFFGFAARCGKGRR